MANIPQVISLFNFLNCINALLAQIDPDRIADYFYMQSCLQTVAQHCKGNFLMECWLRQIKATLYMVIFLQKEDYVVWTNTAPVNVLCNVVSDIFGKHWLEWGLWANTVEVIVLFNVGTSKPRQHCTDYFPPKTCLCAMGQHCISNFLVPCCLKSTWTTFSIDNIPMQCWYSMVYTTLYSLFFS